MINQIISRMIYVSLNNLDASLSAKDKVLILTVWSNVSENYGKSTKF